MARKKKELTDIEAAVDLCEKLFPARGAKGSDDPALHERSGQVILIAEPLACFFYLLLRNHLPAGMVEQLVSESTTPGTHGPVAYSNGWLAQYASDLAQRFVPPPQPPDPFDPEDSIQPRSNS